MIVFQNPGLIDLDAVRTMGVNVKVHANAFGHFGTGLKFAIATILRGGGEITIYRGSEQHHLTAVEKTIRGEPFRIVCLDGDEIGITDQLGKNWEPWMVLRELGCNALDEQGTFFHHDRVSDDPIDVGGENTTIVVAWDALEEAWDQRKSIFCAAEGYSQILATDQVQVLEGRSDHLFYRGVRAYKLERPSEVTYNILSQQTLTEDRTIAHFYYPMGEIRRLWLECTDTEALARVLAPEGDAFERKINYLDTNKEPTREFLDTVLDLRGDKQRASQINETAVKLLHRHLRSKNESSIGYSSSRYMEDEFGSAMEALEEIFSKDELRMRHEKLPLVLVDDTEIESGEPAMLENDRIYIARSLLRRGRAHIATTVLPLILEQRLGYGDVADLIKMVVPALIRSHPDLREDDPRTPHLDAEAEEEEAA